MSERPTPETDAVVRNAATADHPPTRLAATLTVKCEKLERERDEALAAFEEETRFHNRTHSELVQVQCKLMDTIRERDEAMEALSGRTVSCAACNHAAIERDEAREKAERYRLEANAMMLQRDEAQKHLQDIEEYGTEEINAAVELRQKLAAALLERDEARSLVDHYREQKDLLPISWDV